MKPESSSAGDVLAVDERRLLLEEGKLALESSFARKWLPTLATAVVGLIAAVFGYVQNRAASEATERARIDAGQATERARIEAKSKDEREWGFKVVEMYFQKRDLFDLTKNPTQAVANLRVLAAVAPAAVQGLLSAEQSRLPAPSDDKNDIERLTSLAAVAEVQAAIAPAAAQKPASQSLQPSTFVVYIQYPEGQQEKALAAQAALQQLGYRAPGIEKVKKVPSRVQVRYYRPEQRELAGKLAVTVGTTLQLPATADNAIQVSSQKQLPSGILELWLPQAAQ